jgi:hypothetical protein
MDTTLGIIGSKKKVANGVASSFAIVFEKIFDCPFCCT